MKHKNNQYNQRRDKIKNICQTIENKNLKKKDKKSLYTPINSSFVYDHIHQLAYCQIPKVHIVYFGWVFLNKSSPRTFDLNQFTKL